MAYSAVELTAPDGGRVVKVEFEDGSVKVFSHEAYNALAPKGEAALKAYEQPEAAEPRSEGLDAKVNDRG